MSQTNNGDGKIRPGLFQHCINTDGQGMTGEQAGKLIFTMYQRYCLTVVSVKKKPFDLIVELPGKGFKTVQCKTSKHLKIQITGYYRSVSRDNITMPPVDRINYMFFLHQLGDYWIIPMEEIIKVKPPPPPPLPGENEKHWIVHPKYFPQYKVSWPWNFSYVPLALQIPRPISEDLD